MRLYPRKIVDTSKYLWIGVYFFSAVLVAVLLFVKHFYGIIPLTEHMLMSYISPLEILCSISLFLFFSKLRIKSKIINLVSASCFSVYLIHANTLVAPYYRALAGNEYREGNYLIFVAIIIGVFLCCVAVDQVRRFIYKHTLGKITYGVNRTSSI